MLRGPEARHPPSLKTEICQHSLRHKPSNRQTLVCENVSIQFSCRQIIEQTNTCTQEGQQSNLLQNICRVCLLRIIQYGSIKAATAPASQSLTRKAGAQPNPEYQLNRYTTTGPCSKCPQPKDPMSYRRTTSAAGRTNLWQQTTIMIGGVGRGGIYDSLSARICSCKSSGYPL